MASSKRVSVSKAKLAEAGEEMEVAGAAAAVGARRSGWGGKNCKWRKQPPRSVWPKSRPAPAI